MNVNIAETPDQVMQACAAYVVETLGQALSERGVARIALAGGTTPRRLYAELATHYRHAIDWVGVEFFFGDERNVPLDHPDSNFRMANETLFIPLDIQARQIFPIISPNQQDPEHDAENYERQLRSWSAGPVPRMDLALVGMGEDGHFASLFPDTPALQEREHLVVVNPVDKLHAHRITLTFPLFEQARSVCFLVTGSSKHDTFRDVQAGRGDTPALRLARQRPTDWFVDQACANGQDQP